METANIVVFYILFAIVALGSLLAVTSKKMMRAATYLLFVLMGTAGLYILLNYHFLFAVQLSVYAGGVLILFIFAILLTKPIIDKEKEPHDARNTALGVVTSVVGFILTTSVLVSMHLSNPTNQTMIGDNEISMKEIGTALMGSDKFQYLLPFEALSILLLAAIIGSIVIARKNLSTQETKKELQ